MIQTKGGGYFLKPIQGLWSWESLKIGPGITTEGQVRFPAQIARTNPTTSHPDLQTQLIRVFRSKLLGKDSRII